MTRPRLPTSTTTSCTLSGIRAVAGSSASRRHARRSQSEMIQMLRGPRGGPEIASARPAARSAVPGSGSSVSISAASRLPSPTAARESTFGSMPARTSVTKSVGRKRLAADRTASRIRWIADVPSETSPEVMPASTTSTTSRPPPPKSPPNRSSTGREKAQISASTTAVRRSIRSHSTSRTRRRCCT